MPCPNQPALREHQIKNSIHQILACSSLTKQRIAMRVHTALLLLAALLLLLRSSHVAGFNDAIGGRRLMALGKMTSELCDKGPGNTYDCPRNVPEIRRIIAKWGYAEAVDMCCPKPLPHFTYGSSGAESMSAHTLWWAQVTRGCVGSLRIRFTLTADLLALVTTSSGGFVCPDETWPVYRSVYE